MSSALDACEEKVAKPSGKWMKMLEELREYRHDFGDCLVPRGYPPNKKLATWVAEQRKQYKLWCAAAKSSGSSGSKMKSTSMTKVRFALLEGLGFCWNAQEAAWDRQYEELKRYKKRHGNCLVPIVSIDYPSLGIWVKEQRRHFTKFRARKPSQMTQARLAKLEAIGFCWDTHEAIWWERFEELKQYKAAHGHCMVPTKKGGTIGTWVHHQRRQYRHLMSSPSSSHSSLTRKRMQALDSLGFCWTPRLHDASDKQENEHEHEHKHKTGSSSSSTSAECFKTDLITSPSWSSSSSLLPMSSLFPTSSLSSSSPPTSSNLQYSFAPTTAQKPSSSGKKDVECSRAVVDPRSPQGSLYTDDGDRDRYEEKHCDDHETAAYISFCFEEEEQLPHLSSSSSLSSVSGEAGADLQDSDDCSISSDDINNFLLRTEKKGLEKDGGDDILLAFIDHYLKTEEDEDDYCGIKRRSSSIKNEPLLHRTKRQKMDCSFSPNSQTKTLSLSTPLSSPLFRGTFESMLRLQVAGMEREVHVVTLGPIAAGAA